jgi:glycerophosphoryl diester phosphodiesterase
MRARSCDDHGKEAAMSELTRVCAHRGGAEVANPGTLEAYRDSIEAGADYVEFDVCRTRDGELIAFHDKRAERRGLDPAKLTRSELCREVGYDVLGPYDLLRLVKGRCRAHVDVKAPGCEAGVVEAVLDVLPPQDFLITGLDSVVAAVKATSPEVRCALSVGRGWHEVPWSQVVAMRRSELRPVERVRACGADAAAMHHTLARFGALAACARAGIEVMVWTVNHAALIRRCLADPRVGMLVTDRPRFALAARDGGGAGAP